MIRLLLSLLFSAVLITFAHGQQYNSSSIFAHNDYVHAVPFYNSYHEQAGFIEADVFLQQGQLLVAHTPEEMDIHYTLDSLYLKPLVKNFNKNKGFAYADHSKPLTLMIDLKTEGVSTLDALVKKIKEYPSLLSATNFEITISGNVPPPSLWKNYPDFIHFDGRPGIDYTNDQSNRISLISTSFQAYTKWNGKGVPIKEDRKKIQAVIEQVHAKGKKIRFWATPDLTNAWITLIKMKVDIIGTDDVLALSSFVQKLPASSFQNNQFHQVYQPSYSLSKKSPKNIILLIGDGMGLTQLYSAYTANKGNLNIFNIKDIGFSVTTSADSYITDSAAGATAMASGTKTNNRYIGVDSTGSKLPLITEQLKKSNFKTAIISAGDITDATPASFYAHQPERGLSEAIALDFLSSDNDILIGGKVSSFNNSKDKKNLLDQLSQKGYTVATSFKSLDTIRASKFVVLDDSAVVSKIKGRGDFLSRSLKKSLAVFSENKKPFFIMAEGAQIDYGGHDNNMEYVVRETLDFDQAIGEAMRFVDQNKETLLIITADHETGGLTLLDGSISNGYVQGHFSTSDHTAVMVPVFSYGPGAENFKGVYQNTDLPTRILKILTVK